ncbi:MAG TPA: class I SAM-dependent methyltransferase [Thermoplasmata archaeon]|nr:class I SAM-dependent methyltransferase [Thermoplasmata archaeon]
MRKIDVFRSEHPDDTPRRDHGLRPRARALLREMDFSGLDVLDLGTGRGRLAFLLAPRCRSVTGIDIDVPRLERARELASRKAVSNIRFLHKDAEKVHYRSLVPGLGAVVANLCMSLEMVARAGDALERGGILAFTCFHPEHWKETGSGSSHAIEPEAILETAARVGLELRTGFVEVDVYPFSSMNKLVGLYVGQGSRGRKWERDGRLARLLEHARRIRPEVTEAYLTAHFEKARA